MIYDIKKTYLENLKQGPCFKDELPNNRALPPEKEWVDFLGFPVSSRLGIPAGPLLSSEWIKLATQLGYDIVTYKTIRSSVHEAHPLPNIVYIDPKTPLSFGKGDALCIENPPQFFEDLAITNSFGMPSSSPNFILNDIPKAYSSLNRGQVMVVSIVGSQKEKKTFIEDFSDTAVLAKKAGAKILEANFSCPNVASGEGAIYTNPKTVFEIASQLVKTVPDLPIILKVGAFPHLDLMREVFLSAARAGVRAISGINTISKNIVNIDKTPALGNNRLTGGVCGTPIRNAALHFIRNARHIINTEGINIQLIGVGGVTLPKHVDIFLEEGADFVQTATGMMWNPFLAANYHKKQKG